MIYRVIYEPEAQTDLLELYRYIAERSDSLTALNYIERIEDSCDALGVFPVRGSAAEDIWPVLRLARFERRVTIAFAMDENSGRVVRILYGRLELSQLDFVP